MTRLVIDASVLVSAAIAGPESRLSLLLSAVRAGEAEMVACDHLFDEVDRALRSPYFAERVTSRERSTYLAALRAISVRAADPENPPRILRDPDDDYLVALASRADARAIVTGDGDLLDHPNLQPPAITVRDACGLLGISEPT